MAREDLERVLDQLGEAAAALGAELTKVREEWAPDEIPATIVMGALGDAAIANDLGDDELGRVSAAIEDAMANAPDHVKDAVATGLLEAAIAATEARPEGARFLGALGPLAKAYCREWDEFTGRRSPGVWD